MECMSVLSLLWFLAKDDVKIHVSFSEQFWEFKLPDLSLLQTLYKGESSKEKYFATCE